VEYETGEDEELKFKKADKGARENMAEENEDESAENEKVKILI
jgi:hypothetical protein